MEFQRLENPQKSESKITEFWNSRGWKIRVQNIKIMGIPGDGKATQNERIMEFQRLEKPSKISELWNSRGWKIPSKSEFKMTKLWNSRGWKNQNPKSQNSGIPSQP